MRNNDPDTVADLIEEMCEQFGIDPNQHISTLMKACEDVDLEDDLEDDEYEDD